MHFSEFDLDKIQSSTDCICGFDTELNIILWNPAIVKKCNIETHDALGKSLFHFFPDVKEDFRTQCMREAMTEDKSFYFSGLPYLYTTGIYTQLIIPFCNGPRTIGGALSIDRDHGVNEKPLKGELLDQVLGKKLFLQNWLDRKNATWYC